VNFEMVSREMSALYTSDRCAWISPVVRPLAHNEITMASHAPQLLAFTHRRQLERPVALEDRRRGAATIAATARVSAS